MRQTRAPHAQKKNTSKRLPHGLNAREQVPFEEAAGQPGPGEGLREHTALPAPRYGAHGETDG